MKSSLSTPRRFKPSGAIDVSVSNEPNVDHISALYQRSIDWVLVLTGAELDKFAHWQPNTLVILCIEAAHERPMLAWRATSAKVHYCRRSDVQNAFANASEHGALAEGPVTLLRHKQMLLSLSRAFESDPHGVPASSTDRTATKTTV